MQAKRPESGLQRDLSHSSLSLQEARNLHHPWDQPPARSRDHPHHLTAVVRPEVHMNGQVRTGKWREKGARLNRDILDDWALPKV